MAEGSYKTVRQPGADEFIEKRSRFIGSAAPVTSEKEALDFIAQKKAEYWDANHNVYAYILREGNIQRFSDDGEPQGTAGIPVLEVIKKGNITDVVVVVTRYFGGILLGAGGLVRAYSHGAKIGVEAAEIKHMRPAYTVELDTDYSLYGKIAYILPKYHIQEQKNDFGVSVRMQFNIAAELFERFKKELTDITNGAIYPYIQQELYADIPLDE